ncbi:hypothetical protein evm_013446 [Chilo suppressalis]|nr:hypothetical protein evm_013446 [Chilo suppressalis]
MTNETEEIYSPVVSEYLPPEENVLTPEADTESINEQPVENYSNHQKEDIFHQIVPVENVEEQFIPPIEEQPTASINQDSSLPPNAAIENAIEQVEDRYGNEQMGNVLADIGNNVQNCNEQSNKEPANEEEAPTSIKKKYPKKNSSGRKRVLNKENWKNSICKRKKNLGEEFINKKGQLIPKKEMKPSCGDKCSRKCHFSKQPRFQEQRLNVPKQENRFPV